MKHRWLTLSLLMSVAPLAIAAQPWQKDAAHGIVKKIDAVHGVVTLDAGPVASLNMPAMVMDYTLASKSMAAKLRGGENVDFTVVARGNDYIVDHIAPAAH